MHAIDPKSIRVDLQMVADMIEPDTRVLDAGCGNGMLLDYLWHFKRVEGHLGQAPLYGPPGDDRSDDVAADLSALPGADPRQFLFVDLGLHVLQRDGPDVANDAPRRLPAHHEARRVPHVGARTAPLEVVVDRDALAHEGGRVNLRDRLTPAAHVPLIARRSTSARLGFFFLARFFAFFFARFFAFFWGSERSAAYHAFM